MRPIISTLIVITLALGAPAAQSDPKSTALGWIDDTAETLKRINRNIWTFAETRSLHARARALARKA